MNFDNEEESLELINRLLERLHQAGYKAIGCININIYKPGSQHVDRVEDQYIEAYPLPFPKGKESKTEKEHKQTSGDLAKRIKLCIRLLMQEKYGEEPLFNQQSHWQAVYRILVDRAIAVTPTSTASTRLSAR